jgi:hypothetical protein
MIDLEHSAMTAHAHGQRWERFYREHRADVDKLTQDQRDRLLALLCTGEASPGELTDVDIWGSAVALMLLGDVACEGGL